MKATESRILIIADDLTGAMDAAGPFAAHGLRTWVVACPDDCDARTFADAQVVSVNTESRHLGAAEAAARVAECHRRVDGRSFAVAVKKIDSTLRGNLVAETAAMLRASGTSEVIVAPAFPAQGRTVRGGRVFVGDVPLEQTAFVRDALSPALAIPLAQAFADAGIAVTVRDAQTDGELDAVVAGLPRTGSMPLIVGSAGITSALARAMARKDAPARTPSVIGRIVFVIGSRAHASREQVARLAADGATVVNAPNGIPASLPAMSGQTPIVLLAVPDSEGREGDAGDVARALALHGLALARQPGVGALVATGGDTAIALLRESGNAALQVDGELMPGIACAKLMLDGTPIALVTKAGGFGDPEALREIGRRLRGPGVFAGH